MALICINIDKLPGNTIAPPLVLNQAYDLKRTYICKCGEVHCDVGLKSTHNFIRCYKCGEELPDGTNIHWAHSSRFKEM
jgi:hypothetical protein